MMRPMLSETVAVRRHEILHGEYRVLEMTAPGIGPHVTPGQFVHLLVPGLDDALLRRPFSIYRADHVSISILYKPVGKGTRAMVDIAPGQTISLIGPLGNGFPVNDAVKHPLLVAGGYGMAALYMVAAGMTETGTIFMGGRTAADILCVDDFRAIDWTVEITTEDGSLGRRGLVTAALDDYLSNWKSAPIPTATPEFFACGPNPMLRAVSDRARHDGYTAWLSMDRNMGCGVGACLVCVQKVRDPRGANGDWIWARVCTEGPVFECKQIVWDEHE
jgi:dihydroorotate dehydrogenase electron transfer subunit